MVAINPFNYEQIAIIFIFLSILLGVLLFVRKNKDKFSLKLRNKSSILVLEDTAISQSERLRLIKVGDEGHQVQGAADQNGERRGRLRQRQEQFLTIKFSIFLLCA